MLVIILEKTRKPSQTFCEFIDIQTAALRETVNLLGINTN